MRGGAAAHSLEQLLAESDVVSLHVPLTPNARPPHDCQASASAGR